MPAEPPAPAWAREPATTARARQALTALRLPEPPLLAFATRVLAYADQVGYHVPLRLDQTDVSGRFEQIVLADPACADPLALIISAPALAGWRPSERAPVTAEHTLTELAGLIVTELAFKLAWTDSDPRPRPGALAQVRKNLAGR